MRILVVGSGGREHALAWRCKQDLPECVLHLAPGNAGMARLGELHRVAPDDVPGLLQLALRLQPDLVILGPEASLAAGATDVLRTHGMRVFGPMMDAARLESSKAFAKEVMADCGVATARFWLVRSTAEADEGIAAGARVVKADGLAAGKGVTVCDTAEETRAAVERTLAEHGAPVILEERLVGREVSVLALCDGERAVMLPSVQDHKRLGDHDEGPNTGGMGTVSPGTHGVRLGMSEDALLHRVKNDVVEPVLQEMAERETPFVGTLFAGLMVNPEDGSIKVLEFNARFGDPETQVLMRRLKGNVADALLACAEGDATRVRLSISEEAAVCVVMAADGYPGTHRKGDRIDGLDAAAAVEGVELFHAGTTLGEGGAVITDGGRVLGVTATGMNVPHALDRAYHAVSLVRWPGVRYRRDIGRVAS